MLRLPTAATITAVTQDNYRTKTFTLDLALPATPGQFVMVWLPRFDEKPFSLVNANPVTLMITAVGPFSRLLHEKQPGDKVWLRGPFGQGYSVPPTQRRLALVGGGYGVAPLYWLAHAQSEQAETIDVIIGARTAADLLYIDRFQALLQSKIQNPKSKITLHCTTEDGSAGQQGRVTGVLQPLLASGRIDGIHACGPHGMLTALERLGQEYKVPGQLSWEAYMRCGIGICGSCEHEGKVLCLDGPVLATG
jgi:dihydroorotate dehydrogenase electron transfer subunit